MKIITIFLLLLSPVLLADDSKKSERLAKVKAMALERIETKISHLEKNKACVNAANSKEDMKACRKQGKENRKKMKEEFKAKRMAFKNSRNK